MPDNMTSERSSIDAFRSLGQPAKLPGAEESTRAAQEFPQPLAYKEVPDIRMQLDPKEEEGINMMDMLRAMSGRAATSGLEKFTSGLQRVENQKKALIEVETMINTGNYGKENPNEIKATRDKLNREIAEAPEILKKKYNAMAEQSLGVINDLYGISIDQKKNAYPYDHRTAELTIKMVLETAQTLQEEESLQNPEAQVWLKRMERDATWMAGFLQVSVAQSASAPYYFDVVMQLQVLKERYKAFIRSEDLQNMHQKDPPGFEFSAQEQKLIEQKRIGLAVDNKYRVPERPGEGEEGRLFKNKENLGLREIGIKMIDSSFATRMRMAAVSQVDFEAANPETTSFMGNNLKPEEFIFYTNILWRNKNGEGAILAPHMVSKDREKKEISAILEAMLTTNAEERLNEIIAGNIGNYANKNEAISELVKAVKREAAERMTNWKSRDKKDIVSQLATLITKQGLYEDFAFLNVYKYCWQYIWDTDADGRVSSKKKVDTAGIYSYSGDAYSLYFMKRAHQYDKLGNSRTQALLPTSKAGRTEIEMLPYDKMPKYEPGYPGDQDRFLAGQWNLLFGTDATSTRARKELGYQDIPEEVAAKLKKWAVRWRTPFSSKYVEGGTNYELIIPHLMPPGLDVACFLEAVTNSDTKLNKGGISAFQELIEGMRLSQVDWGKQENLPHDRWLVDLDMASRFMKILIEVHDKEKDPFMGIVTGNPGTLGPKEFAKRLRLTFRDSGKGMPEEYEVAFIPYIITLACANKYGLSSAAAWNLADGKSTTTAVENFLLEMSEWQRAFKWLPSDRPDTGLLSYNPPRYNSDGTEFKWNYGNTMALIAEFYIGVLLRMSKSSAEESRLMTTYNYEKTARRVNSMLFMGTGKLNRKINEDIIPNM